MPRLIQIGTDYRQLLTTGKNTRERERGRERERERKRARDWAYALTKSILKRRGNLDYFH